MHPLLSPFLLPRTSASILLSRCSLSARRVASARAWFCDLRSSSASSFARRAACTPRGGGISAERRPLRHTHLSFLLAPRHRVLPAAHARALGMLQRPLPRIAPRCGPLPKLLLHFSTLGLLLRPPLRLCTPPRLPVPYLAHAPLRLLHPPPRFPLLSLDAEARGWGGTAAKGASAVTARPRPQVAGSGQSQCLYTRRPGHRRGGQRAEADPEVGKPVGEQLNVRLCPLPLRHQLVHLALHAVQLEALAP